MSSTKHRQCRDEPGYFEAFQKGVQSRGLGDTIAKITAATGVKAVVDKVSGLTGVDCGCEERQELLNKMFPYKEGKQ